MPRMMILQDVYLHMPLTSGDYELHGFVEWLEGIRTAAHKLDVV